MTRPKEKEMTRLECGRCHNFVAKDDYEREGRRCPYCGSEEVVEKTILPHIFRHRWQNSPQKKGGK